MTRLEILQALQTQLQTITTANGYHTNLGQNVEYFTTYELDYDGPAAVTFRDVDTEYQRINTRYSHFLTCEIEALAWTTPANKLTDSCHILEDLNTAIVLSPWHPGVIAVRPRTDSKQIEARGKQCISFQLDVEIEYRVPVG